MSKERFYYVVADMRNESTGGTCSFLSIVAKGGVPSISEWQKSAAEMFQTPVASVVITNFIEVNEEFARQYCEEKDSSYFKLK